MQREHSLDIKQQEAALREEYEQKLNGKRSHYEEIVKNTKEEQQKLFASELNLLKEQMKKV